MNAFPGSCLVKEVRRGPPSVIRRCARRVSSPLRCRRVAIKMDVCEKVNSSERRLFVEQIATVVALGCGRKADAMWHVPQCS